MKRMQTIPGILLRCIKGFVLLAVPSATLAQAGFASCYATPQAAIRAATTGSAAPTIASKSGYEVIRIKSDRLLGTNWAEVGRCFHPEWSTLSFPVSKLSLEIMSRTAAGSVSAPILVRAGDSVRLFRREPFLQIEVAGISEGTAGLGGTVRVRLVTRSSAASSAPEELTGVVRGRSVVEMTP